RLRRSASAVHAMRVRERGPHARAARGTGQALRRLPVPRVPACRRARRGRHRRRSRPMTLALVTALTLDLDDTLWPVRPALVAAERVLADWLRTHAPATAGGLGQGGMLALRAQVAAERPDWAHDLTAIRMETIRRALRLHGDDPALAEAAF